MLGPALVVLITPLIGPQIVFLVSAVFVFLLTLASAFGLRVPQRNQDSSEFLKAAVSR